MPYSVKGIFEKNENMVQTMLMLGILLTQDSKIDDLYCPVPTSSESLLFFAIIFSAWGLNLFNDDLQHRFARITDKADISIVLTKL